VKKAIVFSLIILGITSIVSQLIVIRELNTSFSGNEFFIGWTLFSWLFWTGIGSLLLNKLVKEENIFKFLVISNVLIPISLILEIFLIRFSRILTTAQAGQIPNLIPALLYGFIVLAPLCLILGLQFTIIARLWKYNYQGIELSRAIGKSYILETIGFIIGGLAFSYFLIFINEFYSTSIIAWLNLSAGIFILAYRKITGLKFLSIVLFGFFILIFIFSPFIYYQTSSFRFPNQILIESKNSLYGNIAVTQLKDQYNFYENGLYLGTNKEEILNEYVHIPLLYHRNPKNVLLIGAGFNGIIKEIIKHNPEKIIYLELDYNLIKIAKEHLSNDLSIYLDDKRVKIINADARYFLKNSSEKFDLIIVNLPNPSTALINRFYTDEFYKEAKIHLSENGILSTYLKLSTNYFGPEVENLDASLRKALNNNFDYVLIFPEDQHLFIVSQDKIDYNPNSLIQRLKERNIKTNFVNEEYIEYRLTNDRVKTLNDLLDKNQTAKINQDQLPVSYYYNLIYWVSSFHPKLAKIFQRLGEINFIWIIIFLIVSWFLVLFSSQKKSKNNTQNLLPIAMAIAGFSLMAIEIIIIFGFQIFYGYLYYKISLIISALMTGMALGSWLANRKLEQKSIKSVIKIHTLIIVFSLILLFGFYSLFRISLKPSIFIEITFLIATGLIGTIVGFEFPVINRLYLENKNNTPKKTGVIYGADLIGSCLGALLASIFFIPIFGIYQALILLGILNFLIIIPLIISRLHRQKPEQ
jgi:spermidine synthase